MAQEEAILGTWHYGKEQGRVYTIRREGSQLFFEQHLPGRPSLTGEVHPLATHPVDAQFGSGSPSFASPRNEMPPPPASAPSSGKGSALDQMRRRLQRAGVHQVQESATSSVRSNALQGADVVTPGSSFGDMSPAVPSQRAAPAADSWEWVVRLTAGGRVWLRREGCNLMSLYSPPGTPSGDGDLPPVPGAGSPTSARRDHYQQVVIHVPAHLSPASTLNMEEGDGGFSPSETARSADLLVPAGDGEPAVPEYLKARLRRDRRMSRIAFFNGGNAEPPPSPAAGLHGEGSRTVDSAPPDPSSSPSYGASEYSATQPTASPALYARERDRLRQHGPLTEMRQGGMELAGSASLEFASGRTVAAPDGVLYSPAGNPLAQPPNGDQVSPPLGPAHPAELAVAPLRKAGDKPQSPLRAAVARAAAQKRMAGVSAAGRLLVVRGQQEQEDRALWEAAYLGNHAVLRGRVGQRHADVALSGEGTSLVDAALLPPRDDIVLLDNSEKNVRVRRRQDQLFGQAAGVTLDASRKVVALEPLRPASQAGVQAGWMLARVNGADLESGSSLENMYAETSEDQDLEATFTRSVRLCAQPLEADERQVGETQDLYARRVDGAIIEMRPNEAWVVTKRIGREWLHVRRLRVGAEIGLRTSVEGDEGWIRSVQVRAHNCDRIDKGLCHKVILLQVALCRKITDASPRHSSSHWDVDDDAGNCKDSLKPIVWRKGSDGGTVECHPSPLHFVLAGKHGQAFAHGSEWQFRPAQGSPVKCARLWFPDRRKSIDLPAPSDPRYSEVLEGLRAAADLAGVRHDIPGGGSPSTKLTPRDTDQLHFVSAKKVTLTSADGGTVTLTRGTPVLVSSVTPAGFNITHIVQKDGQRLPEKGTVPKQWDGEPPLKRDGLPIIIRTALDGDYNATRLMLRVAPDLARRRIGDRDEHCAKLDTTPLHAACYAAGSTNMSQRRSAMSVVQDLLRAGSDVVAKDADGWTPLHWAVAVRNVNLLNNLLNDVSATHLAPADLCVPTYTTPSQLSTDTGEEWRELCLCHPLLGREWADEHTRLTVTRGAPPTSGFITAHGRVRHQRPQNLATSAFDFSVPDRSLTVQSLRAVESDGKAGWKVRVQPNGWQLPPTGHLDYPIMLQYDMRKRRLRVYRGEGLLEFEAFVHPLTGHLEDAPSLGRTSSVKLYCKSTATEHREASEAPCSGKQQVDTLLHWVALRGDKASVNVLFKNLIVGQQRRELKHDDAVARALLTKPNYAGELPFVVALMSEGISRTADMGASLGFGGGDDEYHTITLSAAVLGGSMPSLQPTQTTRMGNTCVKGSFFQSMFREGDEEGFPITRQLLKTACSGPKQQVDAFVKELRKWTHDPTTDRPRLPYMVRRKTRQHGEKPLQQLLRFVRQALAESQFATLSQGKSQLGNSDLHMSVGGSTRVSALFRSEVLGLLDSRVAFAEEPHSTTKARSDDETPGSVRGHDDAARERHDEQELLTLVLLRVVHDACAVGDSDLLTEMLHGGTAQELEKRWGRLTGAAWVVKYENRVESALSLACRFGHLSVVRTLVEEFRAPITAHGNIALLQSLEARHFDVAAYLLSEARGGAGLHRLRTHEGDAFFIPSLDELQFALNHDLLSSDYLHWCVTNVSRWMMPLDEADRARLRSQFGRAALIVMGMQNDYMDCYKRSERWCKVSQTWTDASDSSYPSTGAMPVPLAHTVVPRIRELWRSLRGVLFDRIVLTQAYMHEESKAFRPGSPRSRPAPSPPCRSRVRRPSATPWRKARHHWDQGLPHHCVRETEGADFRGDLVSEQSLKNVHRLWRGKIDEVETAEIIRLGGRRAVGRYSAFHDTDGCRPIGLQSGLPLGDYLRKHGVRHVYVCGVPQEHGVIQTATDALAEGFQATIIVDCTKALRRRRDSGDLTTPESGSALPSRIVESAERGCGVIQSASLMQGVDQTRTYSSAVLRILVDSPQVDLSFIFHHSVDSDDFHRFLGSGGGIDFGDADRRGEIFLHMSVLCSAGQYSAAKYFPDGFTLAGLRVKAEHFPCLQWPLQYLMVIAREGQRESQQPGLAILHAVIDVINKGCESDEFDKVSFGVGADGRPTHLVHFARTVLPHAALTNNPWGEVFDGSDDMRFRWAEDVLYHDEEKLHDAALFPLELAVRLGMDEEVERMLCKGRGLRRRRERGFGVDYEVEVVEDWWRPPGELFPLHGALRELRHLRTLEGAQRLTHSSGGSKAVDALDSPSASINSPVVPESLELTRPGPEEEDALLEQVWARCVQGQDAVRPAYQAGSVLCLCDDSWSSSGAAVTAWRMRRNRLIKVAERLLRSGQVTRNLWFRGQPVDFVPLSSPRGSDRAERRGRQHDRCGLFERSWPVGSGITPDENKNGQASDAGTDVDGDFGASYPLSPGIPEDSHGSRQPFRAGGAERGLQVGDTGLSLLLQGAPELLPTVLETSLLVETARRLGYDGLDALVTRSDATVIVQHRHLWRATQGGHEVLGFDRGLGLLHWACLRDSPELLRQLIDLSAPILRAPLGVHDGILTNRERWVGRPGSLVCSTTELGFTVLHYACYSYGTRCIDLILSELSHRQLSHANVAQFINLPAFHRISVANREHELTALDLEEIEVAVRGSAGWCGVEADRGENWADWLFGRCRKLSTDGMTALHIACQFGHIDCAELLLNHSADCTQRDRCEGLDAHDVALALRNRLTVDEEEGWVTDGRDAAEVLEYVEEQQAVLDGMVKLLHTHPASGDKVVAKFRSFAGQRFLHGPPRTYIIFAVLLTVAVMLALSSSFWLRNALFESIVGTHFVATEIVNGTPASGMDLRDVTSTGDFVLWLRGPFRRALWGPPGQSFVVGAVRILQLRVDNDSCPAHPSGIERLAVPCYGAWSPESSNETAHSTMQWRSESSLVGYVYSRWTGYRWPEGIGLVLDLPSNASAADAFTASGVLASATNAFDRATRFISIVTTFYNPGTAHFIVVEVYVEFPPEGHAYVGWRFSPFRVDLYETTEDWIRLAFELVFILLLMHYTMEEVLDTAIVWRGCSGDCARRPGAVASARSRAPLVAHLLELGTWCLATGGDKGDSCSRYERLRRVRVGGVMHVCAAWGYSHDLTKSKIAPFDLSDSSMRARMSSIASMSPVPFGEELTPPQGDDNDGTWKEWLHGLLNALDAESPLPAEFDDIVAYAEQVWTNVQAMSNALHGEPHGCRSAVANFTRSCLGRCKLHLGSSWNLLDIIIAILGWTAVGLRITASSQRLIDTDVALFSSSENAGIYWHSLPMADVQSIERRILAVLVVLVWIKLFKVIRELPFVGPAVGAVVAVLYSESFCVFVLIYLEILCAFTLGAFVAFSYSEVNYRNIQRAFFNIFSMMAGTWEWSDHEDGYLAQLVFFIVIFFCHIVLLNIFIAVVSDAYSVAYRETRLEWNELIAEGYVRHHKRLDLPGSRELPCFDHLGTIPSFFLSTDPQKQYKLKRSRQWYWHAADRKAIENDYRRRRGGESQAHADRPRDLEPARGSHASATS
eukprot:TRINITY_DN16552_c0_g1_i3.p1 TRINITY_DN16552_c0_g1~~TRINITY_DN16552_c0_g1_i3.p1  ORF type:complete len:3502 (+),score=788.45 TRINITY_DN16552_c0_g1_i3:90-10595(+)